VTTQVKRAICVSPEGIWYKSDRIGVNSEAGGVGVSTTFEPRVRGVRIRPLAAGDGRMRTPNASRSEWPLVLVIAAQTSYRQTLATCLSNEGFRVESAADVCEGLQVHRRNRPDLVLLDAVGPDHPRIELRQMMKSLSPTPLIIVSASNSELDVVGSLEVGAADYVFKPLRMRELVARMRAVLRRLAAPRPPVEVLKQGPITLDLGSYEVYANGNVVAFTRREFELLHLLMTHVGQVVTRESCIDRIWRGAELLDTRTLDTHVKRIRTKIEPDPANPRYLVTFRGIGYQFDADPLRTGPTASS
jgi:two-component system, OmpR family, response regulator RegX3